MKRVLALLVAGLTVAAVAAVTIAPGSAATGVTGRAATTTAPWILHIQRYPGGISNGVRATYESEQLKAALGVSLTGSASGTNSGFHNFQMNTDFWPPMPQNETAVALDPTNP